MTLPTQTGDPHANGRIHVFAVADDGTPVKATAATGVTAKSGTASTVDARHGERRRARRGRLHRPGGVG